MNGSRETAGTRVIRLLAVVGRSAGPFNPCYYTTLWVARRDRRLAAAGTVTPGSPPGRTARAAARSRTR